MNWQLPAALLVLAQARAATGEAGVGEALDEATAVASSRGHRVMLRKIDADRATLTPA
jgi:hypothetical protein